MIFGEIEQKIYDFYNEKTYFTADTCKWLASKTLFIGFAAFYEFSMFICKEAFCENKKWAHVLKFLRL